MKTNRLPLWGGICAVMLLALPAFAVVIDCGSATDANFSGGIVHTIPAPPPEVADATLRYGTTFTYTISTPGLDSVPYRVILRFIEPSVQGVGQRVFSVAVNNHPVIDRLDLVAEAGYLKPLARSFVVFPGGGEVNLKLVFTTQVRYAVVSSIEVTPMPIAGGVEWEDLYTVDGAQVVQLSFVTTYAPAGLVQVFRDGLRMRINLDYVQSVAAGGLVTVSFLQPPLPGAIITLQYRK